MSLTAFNRMRRVKNEKEKVENAQIIEDIKTETINVAQPVEEAENIEETNHSTTRRSRRINNQ